jgi:hypothetical protein
MIALASFHIDLLNVPFGGFQIVGNFVNISIARNSKMEYREGADP